MILLQAWVLMHFYIKTGEHRVSRSNNGHTSDLYNMVQNAYDYQYNDQLKPSKLITISDKKMPDAAKVKLGTEGNF